MAYSAGGRQVGWGALSACYDGGKEPAMCVARAGRGGGVENGNCNFFCPRRATKGREGPRRTATATSGTATATSERQRQLQNGNGNTFCPRRTAKGHEGPRRTATATSGTATSTPFVHGGHRGPRRTATATAERQRQLLLSTKGREELQRQLQERQPQHLLSTEDTEGHGERQLQLQSGNGNAFCPRRTAKGHEGPRRTATATSGTATATPFVHEGPLRATKGREELQGQHLLSTKDR